jgi:hypothetical protein
MQKSYLVKTSVDFGNTSKFLIRPGDILVFDSQNHNKVTVYRGGEIVRVLPDQSLGGLTGLAKSGWIAEIHPNDAPRPVKQPPKPPVVAPQTPLEGVKAPGNGKTANSKAAKSQTPRKPIPDSTI